MIRKTIHTGLGPGNETAKQEHQHMTKETRKKVDNDFVKTEADYLEYAASHLHMSQSAVLEIILEQALCDPKIIGEAVTYMLTAIQTPNPDAVAIKPERVSRTFMYDVNLYKQLNQVTTVMSKTEYINTAVAAFRLNPSLHNWLMEYRLRADTAG